MFFYNQIVVLDLRHVEFVVQSNTVLSPGNFLLIYYCSVPLILWGQTLRGCDVSGRAQVLWGIILSPYEQLLKETWASHLMDLRFSFLTC